MEEFAGFFGHFAVLPDPRVERGKKHRLMDVLFIGLAAILSGGETFSDMEEFGEVREEWLGKYCFGSFGFGVFLRERLV